MTTSVAMFKPETLELTRDAYLGGLLQQCEYKESVVNEEIGLLLAKIRQKAASVVVKSDIPSKKDEKWRFTDLSELVAQDFRLATKPEVSNFVLNGFILSEAYNSRLVLVNGAYAPELSDISGLPEGVYVGNLGNLPSSLTDKIGQYLARHRDTQEVFTALNTAGITDAAVIWVNANVEVTTPIHLLHLTVTEKTPSFAQPRILVVAERGARVQLIEYYGAVAQGCSDTPHNQYYFTNTVTEIYLQENAQLNHSRIQRESGDGFHIGKTAIAQERYSRYTGNEISLGGKLYRHNLQINQLGEQTETYLNGLSMIEGKQLADTHSQVNLTQPHGTVNQLHKYIIDESAQGVFHGKIHVPQKAQLTNAAQLNRNLLLSPKARINTKPELQITADNVKCSHGATISQLEAEEIFYLRSRGLNEYDARHLLIDAFAAEILDKLPFESLRHRLSQCVACRTID
jgi:Fe-S cluster assembly protein SufD